MKKKSLYFKDHPYSLYESVPNSPFPLPTNSLGLIGKKEYKIKKNKNIKRILVLGASPIERLPPSEENLEKNPNLTITHLLENILNQKNKELGNKTKYEVLNLSSSGYTSYECLFSYICKGRYFEPDLVISYQGVNDILWAVIAKGFLKDYSHSRKNNFSKQECLINDLFCALPDSRIVNFLDRLFVRLNFKKPNGLIYSITKVNLELDQEFSKNKLETFQNNIEMLNNLCNLNKSKLLNLTFVWDYKKAPNPSHIYSELKNKNSKKLFHRHYNKYLSCINKFLLSHDKLITYELKRDVFNYCKFSDGVHFNLKGMELFASLVADYIISNQNNIL